MAVIPVFTLLGGIIILGFIGNYFFKRTNLPDIIILLVLGLLLGPILHLINPGALAGASQIFSSLALMILLFEGGLHLNLYKVIQQSPRASLLAMLVVLISMGLTMGFVFLVWKWDLISGLLLGAIIGGSSSSIVVPLISKIKIDPKLATLLSLESTFTDAITVVFGITLLQLLTVTGDINGVYSIFHGITSAFSIGAVFGLIVGIAWLKILNTMKDKSYENILTLAMVFLLFSVVESLGGNGAISSLVFGLVLGNGVEISRMLRVKQPITTGKEMKIFHSEISFLVRTFFFVYLGLIVTIDNVYMVAVGIALSILLFFGRFLAVKISSIGEPVLTKNTDIMTIMLPRGLAAAVLSQLPIIYGIKNAQMYPDIIFTVIISTVLICTVGIFFVSRKIEKENLKKMK